MPVNNSPAAPVISPLKSSTITFPCSARPATQLTPTSLPTMIIAFAHQLLPFGEPSAAP